MLDIENKLDEVLKKSNSLPFLFVGSGMSRRYLDLPNWGGLLKKFLDEDEVEYHIQKTSGDYPKVAKYIQSEFLEIFWKNLEYKKMKDEYKKLGFIGEQYPFKFAISKYFQDIDYSSYALKDEVEELKKANIDGVITTNYDMFLETIFDYKIYKGQDDLLFNKILEIGEIYKIHGCATKFETIIITDDDYVRFKERNLYLTSKLTSLFIEHPIIFLGYSLSDENITTVLKNIAKSIGADNIDRLKDRIIFVEYETDKSKHQFINNTKKIEEDFSIPIKHIKTDDYLSIYKSLSKTKRKIPAKCVRMLEQQMYELSKTDKLETSKTDKLETKAVVDIKNVKDYKDIEFYAGIGIVKEMSNKGYNCIESIDLFEDLIFDADKFNLPENIVHKTLPKLFAQNTYLPIFKYLKEIKIDNENYKEKSLHQKIINIIEFDYDKYMYRSNLNYFEEDKTFIENIFKYLKNNEKDKINLEKFQNFLKENKSILNDEKHISEKTDYKKLACLYDRLKYGWF